MCVGQRGCATVQGIDRTDLHLQRQIKSRSDVTRVKIAEPVDPNPGGEGACVMLTGFAESRISVSETPSP